jgi:hypothetical protein
MGSDVCACDAKAKKPPLPLHYRMESNVYRNPTRFKAALAYTKAMWPMLGPTALMMEWPLDHSEYQHNQEKYG